MTLVPNFQDLSQSSGIIPVGYLESIYHSVMDNALSALGRAVTFHLPPQIEQDVTTQSQIQAAQYNPFFGVVAGPKTNTRQPGVKIVTRDVEYLCHPRVNPVGKQDIKAPGDLKDNQIMITVVIEALNHVKECLNFTIEGRTYSVDETRPIGFSQRRYLMVKGTDINERQNPSPDKTIG